ncbi:YezD family protein [Bacillus norwichensis]|uniref:YezD family protein n=1 Tax=Bacillus norwichensis TaxID=2762217 RepID=A0ABR8VJ17_9BACI|nr:YezD family protein [Bacillus norwichensis]MBD8004768.1 YezD family protein [Bacillus norwichensis]
MSVKEKADNEKLKVIEELLNNLRFGELQITVHEGKIVQINRIEKKRFPA